MTRSACSPARRIAGSRSPIQGCEIPRTFSSRPSPAVSGSLARIRFTTPRENLLNKRLHRLDVARFSTSKPFCKSLRIRSSQTIGAETQKPLENARRARILVSLVAETSNKTKMNISEANETAKRLSIDYGPQSVFQLRGKFYVVGDLEITRGAAPSSVRVARYENGKSVG